MIVIFSPDDICVHSGATDFPADLVNDEEIDLLERQAGHPFLGKVEQFFFAFDKLLWGHGLYESRLVARVFNDGQTKEDTSFLDDHPAHRADEVVEAVMNYSLVAKPGTMMIAQADEHHSRIGHRCASVNELVHGNRRSRVELCPRAGNPPIPSQVGTRWMTRSAPFIASANVTVFISKISPKS